MKRILKWVAISTVLLLAASLIAFYLYDLAGQREWNQWIAEQQARGVKLHVTDYLPPKGPDDQNFGALPIFRKYRTTPRQARNNPLSPKLRGTLPRLSDPLVGKRIDVVEWRKFVAKQGWLQENTDSPVADVRRAYARFDQPLVELEEGVNRPVARFDGIESHGPLPDHGDLSIVEGAVQILSIRAHLKLLDGEGEGALRDLRLIASLCRHLRTQPSLIPAIAHRGTVESIVMVVNEGLQRKAWNDPQLAEVGRILSENDPLPVFEYGLQTEPAAFNDACDEWIQQLALRGSWKVSFRRLDFFASDGVLRVFPGVLRRNQLRLYRYIDSWRHRIQVPDGTINAETQPLDGAVCLCQPEWNAYYQIFYLAAPSMGDLERRMALNCALLRLATTACALERFHLARGIYPDAIQALVPNLLSAVPHEVYGLEPVIYKPTDHGSYQLYLCGENRTDDGGELSSAKPDAADPYRRPQLGRLLDIPWPAPAVH